jgi:hypothetical protein
VRELPDDLERALRELDSRAAHRSAHVSPERVASRVLARLRAEPAEEVGAGALTWAQSRRWVGLAAAAVLMVTGGAVAVRLLQPAGAAPVAVPVVAQGLDSLDVAGLERVLLVTDEVRPQAAGPVQVSAGGTWDDLSEAQLRAVLQAVQQSEGGTL